MFEPDSPYGDLASDSSGRLFLDRDGDSFAIILDWLRRGGRLVGAVDLSDNVYAKLLDEAEFFSLQGLHAQLRKQRGKSSDKKAKQEKRSLQPYTEIKMVEMHSPNSLQKWTRQGWFLKQIADYTYEDHIGRGVTTCTRTVAVLVKYE